MNHLLQESLNDLEIEEIVGIGRTALLLWKHLTQGSKDKIEFDIARKIIFSYIHTRIKIMYEGVKS